MGFEVYGRYQALLNLSLIFQILLDLGISNHNSRTLSQFPNMRTRIFPIMLTARLLLGGLYMAVVMSIGAVLGYQQTELWLLCLILGIQLLTSTLVFIRSTFAGLHLFRADRLLSILDKLLVIICCGALLLYPYTQTYFTIWWFVAIQLICLAVAVIVGFILLKKKTGTVFSFSFHQLKIWLIIRQSLPYASLVFLMFFYTRADALLIDLLIGNEQTEEAGVYAAAYRLLDICNMFGLLFTSMLLPVFGKMLAQKQAVLPLVRFCVDILLPLSFLAAIGSWYYREPILDLLYRNMRNDGYLTFAVLMCSFPAFSISNIYSALLTAGGHLKLQAYAALGGVVINLACNIWLIPTHAALGAAMATLITQIFMAICFMSLTYSKFNLPYPIVSDLKLVGYLILQIIVGWACLLLPIHWMAQLTMLMVIGLGLILVFKFIEVEGVKRWLSKSR